MTRIDLGDQSKMIKCSCCGENKPESCFSKQYALHCIDCYKKKRREYSRKCRAEGRWKYNRNGNWYNSDKEKKRRKNNRLNAIAAYGGKCVRCGFSDWRALQFDHINGDSHEPSKGASFYSRVIREKDSHKYQLLCSNCNWIKRFEENEHSWRRKK